MAKNGRPPASLDEWLDWKQRLESQKASGLSVAVFCLQEGVSLSSFFRWQQQLKSGVPAALLEEEADRRRAESEEVTRRSFCRSRSKRRPWRSSCPMGASCDCRWASARPR